MTILAPNDYIVKKNAGEIHPRAWEYIVSALESGEVARAHVSAARDIFAAYPNAIITLNGNCIAAKLKNPRDDSGGWD